MKFLHFLYVSLVILLLGTACSGLSNPISIVRFSENPVANSEDLDSISKNNLTSKKGLLGVYNLSISPDSKEVELIPVRSSALGEAYMVSGSAYFRCVPCKDCLVISGIGIGPDEMIVVEFSIKHPFDKGDPGQPPTGKNRLDLDVFDVALMIYPHGESPVNFALTGVDMYLDAILNQDGFTSELSNVTDDDALLPYKMCYENPNNNRFEMGTPYQPFEVIFPTAGHTFTLYLTFGYGASATFLERLNPIYFVPEYNRKAAWRINASAPPWFNNNPSTVTIDIYDWNHSATVAADFPDIDNTNHISAASDIESVTVEVPGMTDTIITAETTDTNTNGWDDPITYTAEFTNENSLPAGSYTGLVKVIDSRTPGVVTVGGEPDTLVHTPNGINREFYDIPEFATYQTFIATVTDEPPEWVRVWGSTGLDAGYSIASDASGNLYITSQFEGTTDFDPGQGIDEHTPVGASDAYLIKVDSELNYLWVRTWGGSNRDSGYKVTVDNSGDVYVAGYFHNEVDFDPGAGVDTHTSVDNSMDVFLSKFDSNGTFMWARTWGGSGNDMCLSVDIDGDNNAVLTGCFEDAVDFDPGGGTDTHSSYGKTDIFISKIASDGNYVWAITIGGPENDSGSEIIAVGSSDIVICGDFSDTMDFDPSTETENRTSNASTDIFVARYDSMGKFTWVQTWGGAGLDKAFALNQEISDDLYIGGNFMSTVDFDPTDAIFDLISNGDTDAFLSKFNPDGVFQWAKSWGGTGSDVCSDVAFDTSSNIIAVGGFSNTVDFDPGTGVMEYISNGSGDSYALKLNHDGDFTWCSVWGGTGIDGAYGVVTGLNDRIFITGGFSNKVDFNPGAEICEKESIGNRDAYLNRLESNGFWE